MSIIFGVIAFICFGIVFSKETSVEIPKKQKVICAVLGISMVVAFFATLVDIESSSSSSSSRYEMIENEDGTRKYYDTDVWKETDDGKHIYDNYGNVKEK